MADSKIGVGGTIGIVLGVTAIAGLGLYFVLRPKTASSNVTPNYVAPPSNSTELATLKAQLAILQQQNANNAQLSQAQKDANKAQIEGIAIAIGGKLVTGALDSWISGWNKDTVVVSDNYDYTNADQGLIDDYVYNYGDI